MESQVKIFLKLQLHEAICNSLQNFPGKRKEYQSCPYHSIKAFSAETAGSMDSDVELKVYGAGLDISIDFDKKKVDVFNIQKFLSFHVFGATSVEEMVAFEAPSPYKSETESDGGKSIFFIYYNIILLII